MISRKMLSVSVVIPVHNEAGNIRSLCHEVIAVLAEFGPACEVIVVDDASTDTSVQEVAAVGHPSIRVLQHDRCSGQSCAVRTGVLAAQNEVIATLDGDGQNDPADLPDLVRVLTSAGSDEALRMVIGHRTRRRDSWWRKVASRTANTVRTRLLSDATPDSGCGIKVFYRSAFLELPFFDHLHRFLPAMINRHGGKVRSVPVNHRPRQNGVSHYGTMDRLICGIVDLAGVLWLNRRMKSPEVTEVPGNDQRCDVGSDRTPGTTDVHRQVSRAVA